MKTRLLSTFAILLLTGLVTGFPASADTGTGRDDDDFITRMEREHANDSPVASPATAASPAAATVGESVAYAEIEGKKIAGYLARPAGDRPAPGILVIHEWWGLNDNIRSMADRLAGEGYVALAVDLYEGEAAEEREDAGRLARAARDNPERGAENLRQATAFLQEQGVTGVGVIGWCFGGSWSLEAALLMPSEIEAAVIYYGRVPTDPTELEPLRAPILGLFGEEDGGIPPETVRAFEAALNELGKRASIHIYPGAGHAFANPSGTRYQAAAAEDAWEKTLAFFDRALR